jgi:hypothetical protein
MFGRYRKRCANIDLIVTIKSSKETTFLLRYGWRRPETLAESESCQVPEENKICVQAPNVKRLSRANLPGHHGHTVLHEIKI